jgi:hypothetical protein
MTGDLNFKTLMTLRIPEEGKAGFWYSVRPGWSLWWSYQMIYSRYYVVGYIRPMRDHDIITTSWILKTPDKMISVMNIYSFIYLSICSFYVWIFIYLSVSRCLCIYITLCMNSFLPMYYVCMNFFMHVCVYVSIYWWISYLLSLYLLDNDVYVHDFNIDRSWCCEWASWKCCESYLALFLDFNIPKTFQKLLNYLFW